MVDDTVCGINALLCECILAFVIGVVYIFMNGHHYHFINEAHGAFMGQS